MKCCNGHILSDTQPFPFLQRVSKSLKNWTISPVLQLCNLREDSVCRPGIWAMQIVISERVRVRSLLQPAGESNSSKYQYVMLCLIRGQLPISSPSGWPVWGNSPVNKVREQIMAIDILLLSVNYTLQHKYKLDQMVINIKALEIWNKCVSLLVFPSAPVVGWYTWSKPDPVI